MRELEKNSFVIDEGETKLKFEFNEKNLVVCRAPKGEWIASAFIALDYPEGKTAYEVVEGMIEAFEDHSVYFFKNGRIGAFVYQFIGRNMSCRLETQGCFDRILIPHLKQLIDYDDNPMPDSNDKHMAMHSDGCCLRDSYHNRQIYGGIYTCIFDPSSGEPVVLWRAKK
jgi:hypothetical protein